MEFGKVYIVGAGPGDPGLITVKAMEKLKQADVVVFDRLINDELLNYCKRDCEKIFVGKESGYHPIDQERITNILLQKARLGFNVVRLKGGNPFVFGRGSEEASALKSADIEYEIIPGITSGLSAPIYSGFPITQRGLITQCVLITAHEKPGKPETQVEWEKLAKLKNTSLVIYMGASRIERISDELIKHGMDPAMPVAIIENGTLPIQRTITARLDTIADEYKKKNMHPPVIIMISPTVLLRDEISWFEKKPLFNKRVAVIGERAKSTILNNAIYELGGEALYMPIRSFNEDIWETVSSAKEKMDNIELLNINADTNYNLAYNTNPNNLNSEIFQDINKKEIEKAYTLKHEQENELTNNLNNNGADAFIFTSCGAVQYFFNVFGNNKAVDLLKSSTAFAVNQHAANTLTKKCSIKAKVLSDGSAKGIYDSLFMSFSSNKE